MIGSFWNLCRACPSMPVDKLHSEYRSTYRWHEYTGGHQEVVRRSPALNPAPPTIVATQATSQIGYQPTNHPQYIPNHVGEQVQTTVQSEPASVPVSQPPQEAVRAPCLMEPAMPRRRKHPEIAYRTHMALTRSSPAKQPATTQPAPVHAHRPMRDKMTVTGTGTKERSSGAGMRLRQAISRISTEYRLQFAWPSNTEGSHTPRKSLSMNALRAGHGSAAYTHNATNHELEPLVNEHNDSLAEDDVDMHKVTEDKHLIQRNEIKTEYKKKFRPFSQYEYLEAEGRFTKRANANPAEEIDPKSEPWYKEVIEMRKKAGEYKHRGWGTVLAPDNISELYNKQLELWDQVSRRSSLSALSLATTPHRSITKEEKEKENNNKTSPTKTIDSIHKYPGSAKLMDGTLRSRRDPGLRHHFDRTTGAEDGALLTSPTREKLEPVILKRRDEDHSQKAGSQKGSPQKSSPQKCSSQKSSPQKSSPQKSSPQKNRSKSSPRAGRSQSVGPISHTDNRSPKRQIRANTKPVESTSVGAGAGTGAVTETNRRPRPTSLSTTAPSRSKSNTVSPNKSAGAVDHHPRPLSHDRTVKSKQKAQGSMPKGSNADKALRNQKARGGVAVKSTSEDRGTSTSNKNDNTLLQEIAKDLEPVVKSPPEPTRVKSPEQIIMRSPDPVNWTVPLDTGKTFTVTQNVHDELMNRPHSEVKAWTPPDVPPPAPQSAPPQLSQQSNVQACNPKEHPGPHRQGVSATVNGSGSYSEEETLSTSPNPQPVPIAGTTVTIVEECLKAPSEPASISIRQTASPYRVLEAPELESPSKSLASEVLEKARTRFDRFWAKKE